VLESAGRATKVNVLESEMCTDLRTAGLVICRPYEQETAVPADTGELYSARVIARNIWMALIG